MELEHRLKIDLLTLRWRSTRVKVRQRCMLILVTINMLDMSVGCCYAIYPDRLQTLVAFSFI